MISQRDVNSTAIRINRVSHNIIRISTTGHRYVTMWNTVMNREWSIPQRELELMIMRGDAVQELAKEIVPTQSRPTGDFLNGYHH